MQHECDTSDTSATRLRWEWQKCNTSVKKVQHECYKNNTSATRECYTNDTSVTQVKNLDFDNDTGKNIFSHPYIYSMASERLQREEQLHTKNYRLEMSRFHAKMRLKSAPQKLNLLMAKAISKSCTLGCSCKCSCTFPHRYAQ